MDDSRIISVSEVNQYIKEKLDSDRLLTSVCIRGEISNYKLYPSGHHYFSLKDAGGAAADALKGAGGAATDALKSAGDGLKGLFGK